MAHKEAGRLGEAVTELEAAIAADAQWADAYRGLAWTYAALKTNAKAVEAFRKLVELGRDAQWGEEVQEAVQQLAK